MLYIKSGTGVNAYTLLTLGNFTSLHIMKKTFLIIVSCALIAVMGGMPAEGAPRKPYSKGASTGSSLSPTPKTKEPVTVRVRILQILPDSEGMLCVTSDGTIFVKYNEDDVAEADIVKIKIQRSGSYSYESRGGSKKIGKYKWIPKEGQTRILPTDPKPERVTGDYIEVTDTGLTIYTKERGGVIITGHPDADEFVEGETVSCKVKRTGSHSYVNRAEEVVTRPVYEYVSN